MRQCLLIRFRIRIRLRPNAQGWPLLITHYSNFEIKVEAKAEIGHFYSLFSCIFLCFFHLHDWDWFFHQLSAFFLVKNFSAAWQITIRTLKNQNQDGLRDNKLKHDNFNETIRYFYSNFTNIIFKIFTSKFTKTIFYLNPL